MTNTTSVTSERTHRDRGMALPMALVMSTVLAVVVIGLASYGTTSLKYGRIAENRSDRLSAADAGMRYAIDQLKLRNAGCILDTQKAILPGVQADFNGATAAVTCERITSGFEGIQAYAAVMTGEGLSSSTALLTSQSGSNSKVLGGPVYMTRVDPAAFSLSPPVDIADGPLLYHDTTGTVPCTSVKPSAMPPQLRFDPPLIFGPVCVSVEWKTLFDSPEAPNLTGLTQRNGVMALPGVYGSYTDVSGQGGCRVFEPGWYTTPPDLDGKNAYFKSGNYLFDFDGEFLVRQGVVTAGRINPQTADDPSVLVNDIPNTVQCTQQQANDTAADTNCSSVTKIFTNCGATFYFAGKARINIATQGSLEIHTRQQGAADYVSLQTLCSPGLGNPNNLADSKRWCNLSGGGGFSPEKVSTLTAPKDAANPNFMYTDSGNNKEFVAHGLVYAPLAQIEFGNVSSTATQKMLGGLIVSRLVLQSSTSATNFEISVPTSPITAQIKLTSTAVKDGETSIQAVVEYRPYEGVIDDRIRVNSWRVCESNVC